MPAPAVLRSLVDPRSPLYQVVTAAAIGALSLVTPARLSPGRRFAFRTATATLTGVMLWIEMRDNGRAVLPAETRAGLTAAGVGLTYGVAEWGEAIDGRVHRELERRGVRHPRLVMAAAATAATFAAGRLGLNDDPPASELDELHVDGERRPLDPAARALIAALIDAAGGEHRDSLRRQLAEAEAHHWGDADAGFVPFTQLVTPDEMPRVVPLEMTLPVRGRVLHAAQMMEVSLQVSDGRLAWLSIDPVEVVDSFDESLLGEDRSPLAAWPRVADVTLFRETPEGLLPIA